MTHKRTAVKAMLCCLAIATVVFSPKVLCEDQPSISSESKHENELIQRVETEFADAAKAIGESVYPRKCTVIESGVCKSDCVYSGYESLPDSATINSTSACGIEGSFVDAELCGACHGVQRITTSPTLFGISGATRNYYDSSSNSIASTTNNNNINNDANNEEMEPSSSPYSGPEGEKTRSVDEDACWTRGVDNYLSDLYGKFAGKFLWVSYVAPSGVARVYPGLLRPEHDEAFSAHPWYSAPLAGAKDVVFLLDQSDSVKRNSVWSKAKQLLDTILDSSVSASDYIAAYAVSGNPQRLGTLDTPPDTLERATAGTCYTLRSTFCKSNGGGGSRLSVAFSRAVKLLESSAAEGQTSGCAAHIVLISDADINESTGKIMRDLNKAAERFARNIGRPLHVHVYGLGKYADEDLLRRVTCQHNGVFVRIGKDEEITLDHARAWLTYSVAERTVARAVGSLKSVRNVAWSSIDYLKPSNRMGAVVSIPVYSTINRHYEYPVGVLAGALFTDNFGNFTDVNVTIEEYLLYGSEGLENRGSLCHNYNLPTSVEQSLRKGYFGYQCTRKDMNIKSKSATPAEDPVETDSDDSDTQLSFEFPFEESCNTAPGVLTLKLCNQGTRGMDVSQFKEVYCCNYSETCANDTVDHAIEEEIQLLQTCGVYALPVSNILLFVSVVASLFFSF